VLRALLSEAFSAQVAVYWAAYSVLSEGESPAH
jgi:hypothetical protein